MATLPSQSEWFCLDVFRERASKAMTIARRLKLGTLTHQFSRLPDGRMNITGAIPKSDALELLYFEFRHLYGKEEPGNLKRNMNIISRCSADPRMRCCLQDLKDAARSSMVTDVVRLGSKVPNSATMTSEQIIDAMVNGYIFHSDADRRLEVDRLVAQFSNTGVEVLLFYAVWDFVLAARDFNFLIKDLTPAHPFVLLPRKFSQKGEGATSMADRKTDL